MFIFKGDENESENKAKKCVNCGRENLYTPERSASIWICVLELSERKPMGKGCLSRTEEEQEESKGKGKLLVGVIAPGVKADASGKRRDGDRREMSDRFQTITFEPITVDVVGSQAQPANEVFVTVNVGLHSITVDLTALKAKLDKGAQGNIYTDCL